MLPLPPLYVPARAAQLHYAPDQQQLFTQARAWSAEHAIVPASADRARLHLLLIDVQRDFCFPEGSLYVAGRSGTGAIDDSRRIAEFIYRYLGQLTDITTTMDSHLAFQIFFPSFWVDRHGAPLTPHRDLGLHEVESGAVRPNPVLAHWLTDGDDGALLAHVKHYCSELERAGKYRLYLWPPHCVLGSEGHALVGLIHEARLFHAFARSAQSWVELKGMHPLTENYSVLRPEVLTRPNGSPLAARNTSFLQTLLSADAVIVAGQASSHCVRSTLEDVLDEVRVKDPALARKLYVLTDCMSAVTVPDGQGGFRADFTVPAQDALKRFARAGMHLVSSTQPLSEWADLPRAVTKK